MDSHAFGVAALDLGKETTISSPQPPIHITTTFSEPQIQDLLSMPGVGSQLLPVLPNRMAVPKRWLAMYEDFILKNASSVSQIESALRSITYIIPGAMQTNWQSECD